MRDYSDNELVSLYREGTNPHYVFGLIVRKYQKQLYWHIRRMLIVHDDTDDVLQNTFIKAWEGLPEFRSESRLYTWLYRIATNEALRFLRKKRTYFLIPSGNDASRLGNVIGEEMTVSGDEIQKTLQKAILHLPARQRLVFQMKYYDEMKYEDMAEILNTSVGALKASYHHAVKKIERFLEMN